MDMEENTINYATTSMIAFMNPRVKNMHELNLPNIQHLLW